MSQLLKFATLPARDKVLLLRALAALAVATARLRVLPHAVNRDFITGGLESGVPAPDEVMERVAWAVRVGSRFVPGCVCLPQAIAARSILAAMGYGSTVRIGVCKDESKFAAHAWLECNGKVWVGADGADTRLPWAVLREM